MDQEKLKKTILMSPELSKELDRRCKEWNLKSKGEVLEHLLGWITTEPVEEQF